MTRQHSAWAKIAIAIVVIIIVAVAAWWYFTRLPGVDFSRHGPAPSAPAKASTAPPPAEHPISKAQTGPAPATTTPLPPLDNSDSAVVAALEAIPGAKGLGNLLIRRALIPHIVATVAALPHHAIGSGIVPLRTPGTPFAVQTSNGQTVLNPKNYARYDAYMKIIEAVPARTMVTWYVHWYPLFQQAYGQLGFPQGHFNDQLIKTIDDLLAAPNAQGAVALVPAENGLYDFADPTWQSLSVGQKLMIRVGPQHERVLKDKLRRIRALLLGEAPRLRGAAPSASASHPAPSASAHGR